MARSAVWPASGDKQPGSKAIPGALVEWFVTVLQVQRNLQVQLDDLLQHLLQLASMLQTFAEHNRAVSQQLQLSHGATVKVRQGSNVSTQRSQ